MENSIFISYSHQDTETVNTISQIIESSTGIKVWNDSRLRGGEHYFSVIAEQIMQCTYFVFIVSDGSIESDWCLRELEFAASERKTIIAIWLDNISISPRVKLVIQNTHYINYYSASNESFTNSISRTFLGNGFLQTGSDDTDSKDRDLIWEETYFLDRETLKKIDGLLANEKQKKFSICFQPENAYQLGLAYELGIKNEIDLKRAAFYYKISDYKGNYDGKYLYAAIRSKNADADSPELLAEMIDAAEHHSIYALTYLGDDYYSGRNGCDKNMEKAYAYWKQAAEEGGVVAMYYMAYGHRRGECVKKDYELACMYALMAMEHGFPRAYRILAFMYEHGELFDQDYEKAIEMFEEAIKCGDYLSLCFEGDIYGEQKDYDKERELYEKAVSLAEEGKIKSGIPFHRLGYIYGYGEGVSKDIVKAVEYYFLAAERNHKNALKYAISLINTISDQAQRESFLNRAYELGCENAAYELGNIEKAKGDGKKLSEDAVRYYVKGAEDGDIRCVTELIFNYSYLLGNGTDRNDRLEAIKWFQFFFAHVEEDAEYMQLLRDNNLLPYYYYAYALELDYDPGVNMPDRKFVQLYFQKSLEESPICFDKIVGFIVDGYLFPEDSSSGLKLDVLHAEEMLDLLEKYLAGYHDYLMKNKVSEAAQLWNDVKKRFERGYHKISECYLEGDTVPKNKETARKYKNKAAEVVKMMDGIAADKK